jgi:hypothetical protein
MATSEFYTSNSKGEKTNSISVESKFFKRLRVVLLGVPKNGIKSSRKIYVNKNDFQRVIATLQTGRIIQ